MGKSSNIFVSDGRPGFIIPVEGKSDEFVVGLECKFVVVKWDGVDDSPAIVIKEIAEVDKGTKNRINDGKADPRGRLFAGKFSFGLIVTGNSIFSIYMCKSAFFPRPPGLTALFLRI